MQHPTIIETKEEIIKMIDEEIQALEDRLRTLKSQRNSLSITYTLPPEVLSEIFVIVRFSSVIKKTASTIPDLAGWLPLSHVSRHWRKVALDFPQLWCLIDVISEAAIHEFLVRSRVGSLSIEIRSELPSGHTYTHSYGILAHIFAQSHRFQTLLLQGSSNMFRLLRHIVSAQVPNLQRLTIVGLPDRIDNVSIPDGAVLFGGATPRLDTLSLIACRLSPTSSIFLNDLTNLDVCQSCIGSTTEWLNILRRLPRLSHLKLDSSFTDEASALNGRHNPIPQDFAVVPLLQLSHLTIISSWFGSDVDFLAHIAFPSHTELVFISALAQGHISNPDDLADSPLAAFLQVHSRARRNTSEMDIKGVKLEGWMGYGCHPLGGTVPMRTVGLTVSGETQDFLDVCIKDIDRLPCDEASLSEITSLPISKATSFTTDLDLDHEMWIVLSKWFPNLQMVSISCKTNAISFPNFFLALQGPDVYSSENRDVVNPTAPLKPHEIFPLLQSLELIQFNDERVDSIEEALIDALRARKECGIPIKKLSLKGWKGNTSDFVARLTDLVEDVCCDECVMEGDDESGDNDTL